MQGLAVAHGSMSSVESTMVSLMTLLMRPCWLRWTLLDFRSGSPENTDVKLWCGQGSYSRYGEARKYASSERLILNEISVNMHTCISRVSLDLWYVDHQIEV